jgi:hypothetical protein
MVREAEAGIVKEAEARIVREAEAERVVAVAVIEV